MNKIGKIHTFEVMRETQIGYMLTIDGTDEYFLHKNESNYQDLIAGDFVQGFLYTDKKSRLAVTLILPTVTMDKAGFGKVVEVNQSLGAFLDIGISKDVLFSKDDLPLDYKEWPEAGDMILCYLRTKNDRLIIKQLNKYEILDLDLHFNLQLNEKFKGYVYRVTKDGVNIVTENFNVVFVHKSNIIKQYRIGEEVNVKILRKNIDDYTGSLVESREEVIATNKNKIIEYLNNNDGVMTINDSSDQILIFKVFGISKSAFKTALSRLYSEQVIELHNNKVILK